MAPAPLDTLERFEAQIGRTLQALPGVTRRGSVTMVVTQKMNEQ